MEFKDWLREHMEGKNLSQSELSRQLGYSQSTVSNWLAGQLPDLEKLIRVAQFFGYTLEEVLIDLGYIHARKPVSQGMQSRIREIDALIEALPDPRLKDIAYSRVKNDFAALRDLAESLSEFIESLPTKDG